MAKSETKVRRVKAEDTAKKPKISKYAAKVKGVKIKEKKQRKPLPKFLRIILSPVFFILKPFVAFGRYFKQSWAELKLVRWPNRKETWKMTGAVIAFSVAFATMIVLLDGFFDWIFKLIITK